jgi:hypothetical protein
MKPASDDLETRVANRKRQLISEIIEHKKNCSRSGAAEAIGKLTSHLSELSQIMSAGAELGAGAKLRLADWVTR